MGSTELAQCLTVVCSHITQPKAIQRELLIIMDTSTLICFMEIDCIKKNCSCRYSSTGIAPVSYPHFPGLLSHPDESETIVLRFPSGTEVLLNL